MDPEFVRLVEDVAGVLTPRRRYAKAGVTPGWSDPNMTVWLDGQMLTRCIEASEPLGEAWVWITEPHELRGASGDDLRGNWVEGMTQRRLRGDVEIRR